MNLKSKIGLIDVHLYEIFWISFYIQIHHHVKSVLVVLKVGRIRAKNGLKLVILCASKPVCSMQF